MFILPTYDNKRVLNSKHHPRSPKGNNESITENKKAYLGNLTDQGLVSFEDVLYFERNLSYTYAQRLIINI